MRKIVEDHGGDIALADVENGEGAEVTLTFPFVQKLQKTADSKKGTWKMNKNGSLVDV